MTTEAAGLGLTDVLAAHELRGGGRDNVFFCCCGEWSSRSDEDHTAHVAEEVRTWFRAALTSPEVVAAVHAAVVDAFPWPGELEAEIADKQTTAALAAAAETLGASR